MSKVTREDLLNIVENTEIVRDNFKMCALYDFTELQFSVIGKTPFRDDMCICRDGLTTISPQLLFTPNTLQHNIDEIAEEDKIIIEARILFFNNYKLQFNEHPVKRFKKELKDVAEEIANHYSEVNNKTWAVIKTPDSKLWRLSLMHYISQKIFIKPDNSGGANRLSNYFN